MAPSHTSPTLGFATPHPAWCQLKSTSWVGQRTIKRAGRGWAPWAPNFSVYSVANYAAPCLQTVEVPNIPINDRVTKHERDRCRGGEKHPEGHQTIFLAEVERYEYQGAE